VVYVLVALLWLVLPLPFLVVVGRAMASGLRAPAPAVLDLPRQSTSEAYTSWRSSVRTG
jgi:MFS-type transporter involved in bile tolerance (Atg22 family)